MGALISQNIQYGGATLSQQSTPIGAIIPYMGTTAPSGYLACDGGVYSISLYPLLAGFFEAQFGSINYFGGDGTTTFAVPNLQGEFIRGAGANAHSNQGSGGSVGEHQDGTAIPAVNAGGTGGDSINASIAYYSPYPGNTNLDHAVTGITRGIATNITLKDTNGLIYTSRPTNTSVLYIIKAKSDRLDKITFAEVDDASEADDVVWSGEKISSEISRITEYSTSEKVVGRWIDSKPLHQKTIVVGSATIGSYSNFDVDTTTLLDNVNISVKDFKGGYYVDKGGTSQQFYSWGNIVESNGLNYGYNAYYRQSISKIRINGTWGGMQYTISDLIFTLQYTKTTD